MLFKKGCLRRSVLNLFTIFFMYLFIIIKIDLIYCDNFIKIVYNDIKILHSPSISPIRLHNSVDFIQNYVLQTSDNKLVFDVYKYLQFNGLPFNKISPFNHYHLNLNLPNTFNVHYGFQFTHKHLNLDFTKFSDLDLNNDERLQFISDNLRIYDLGDLKPQYFNFNTFFIDNKILCDSHLKKILNL